MSVVFEATIRVDETENWYIELKDLVDGRIVHCLTIEELEKKVEELGADYGGHIDEVKWLKDDNVPPFVLDEIRLKMAEQRAKIEEKLGELITPVAEKKE